MKKYQLFIQFGIIMTAIGAFFLSNDSVGTWFLVYGILTIFQTIVVSIVTYLNKAM